MKAEVYHQQNKMTSRIGQIKYPLLMAVLGALIFAMTYIFVAYIQRGYHTIRWFDPINHIYMMEFGLLKFNLFADAIFPGLCFLIGVTLFGCGMAHSIKTLRQTKTGAGGDGSLNFSLIYLSLGILFLVALVWYLGWLEPHWESVTQRAEPDGREVIFYRDPVWIRWLISWKVISFLLGLGVTGLGIVQLIKARRKINETTF